MPSAILSADRSAALVTGKIDMLKPISRIASLVFIVIFAASPVLRADKPRDVKSVPLIPRATLFGNPDKALPQISPDGTQLAFLAEVNGVLNVWVGPIDKPATAKAVTKDTNRGIRQFRWAYDSKHILYSQDKGGDENWHVFAANCETLETRDLTPMAGIQARIQELSDKYPGDALIAVNDRVKEFHDIYRIEIATGKKTLVQKNDEYGDFVTDSDMNVRLATKILPDGGSEIFRLDGGTWKSLIKVGPEDQMTTEPLGFDKSGKTLYMTDSRGRNTGALVSMNMDSGEATVLAANPWADAVEIMMHPTEHRIEAVAFNYDRKAWQILDEKIKGDVAFLSKQQPGEADVMSRSLDDKQWIVSYMQDDGPIKYYHYDRPSQKMTFLFTNRKALEGLQLSKMTPVVVKTRDGLNLVNYVSLPVWTDSSVPGLPTAPLPTVLLVHGGPWARDHWGYNGMHQWLANRGYAVISVNYRGSTGFGKKFVNAGNLEWAGKMHDDLIDTVNWAIKEKVSDPAKIAIMGGSYGGYATLVGLTFTPDVFACGVDIVGPSNLQTLIESIPPYWKPIIDVFRSRMGDNTTEEGRKFLNDRSPLSRVDRIKRPLLIGQGANDPRVKQAESDQIVKAMKAKEIPVTYVLFPDEGHGFRRPENSKAFNAVAEAFLAKHLGGRVQPVGDDFKGSSISVPEGADGVPGVKAALAP